MPKFEPLPSKHHIQEELERISVTVETLQLWSERMIANGIIDEKKYNEIKKRIK